MTSKELRHLGRRELIEIIYELQKQNEETEYRIASLQEALDEREIQIANAGSIAEAALKINRVMEAAQEAANQYLLSVRKASEEVYSRATEEAERQQQDILAEAEQKAKQRLEEADRQIAEKWDCFENRRKDLMTDQDELRVPAQEWGEEI